MLVLSRKIGESVVLGNNVRVTVVEVRGDKIKLAFEAPPEVSIHRQEIYDRIQQQNSHPPQEFPLSSPGICQPR